MDHDYLLLYSCLEGKYSREEYMYQLYSGRAELNDTEYMYALVRKYCIS